MIIFRVKPIKNMLTALCIIALLLGIASSCSNLFGDMFIKEADDRLSDGGITLNAGKYEVNLLEDFNSGTKSYKIEVTDEADTLQLYATAAAPSARIIYEAKYVEDEFGVTQNPPIPVSIDKTGKITLLPYGITEVTLTVAAEDNDFKTVYLVRIIKTASTVSQLQALSFKTYDTTGQELETPVLRFFPSWYEYPSRTAVADAAFMILPEAAELRVFARAKIDELTPRIRYTARMSDGTSVGMNNDGSSGTLKMSSDSALILVTVPADRDKNEAVYVIHIKKPATDDATLQSLTLKTGESEHDYSPAFGTSDSYTAYVGEDSLKINAVPSHPRAKVAFAAEGSSIGSDGSIAALNEETTVTVTVTSPDGTNVQTYKIVIIKSKPAPQDLKFNIQITSAVTASSDPADAVAGYAWNQNTYSYPDIKLGGNVLAFGVKTVIESGADKVKSIEYTAKKKGGFAVKILPAIYDSEIKNKEYPGVISAGVSDGEKLPDGLTTVMVKITLKDGSVLKPYAYYIAKPDVSDATLTSLAVQGISPKDGFKPAIADPKALLNFNYNAQEYTIRLPTEVTGITLRAVTSFISRPGEFPDGATVSAAAVNTRHENTGAETVPVNVTLTQTSDTNQNSDIKIDALPAGTTVLTISGKSADGKNTRLYTVTVIKPDIHEIALKGLKTAGAVADIAEEPSSMTSNVSATSYARDALTGQNNIVITPDAYFKPVVSGSPAQKITYAAKNRKISAVSEDGTATYTERDLSAAEISAAADGAGTVTLDDGVTGVTLTVSARDKNNSEYKKDYTITVTKPEITDATLTALRLSGGFSPQSLTLIETQDKAPQYAVSDAVSSVTVEVDTRYKNAAVSAEIISEPAGEPTIRGDISSTVDTITKTFIVSGLKEGETLLAVTVTPKMGSHTHTYYAKIFKAKSAETVTLRSLSLGGRAIGISENMIDATDEIYVQKFTSAKELRIALAAYNTQAQITVTRFDVDSESDSTAGKADITGISFSSGGTTLTGNAGTYTLSGLSGDSSEHGKLTVVKIGVKAGNATKIYYIKIYNKMSSDATLKRLSGTYGGKTLSLSPQFAAGTVIYAADTDINSVPQNDSYTFSFIAETAAATSTLEWQTAEVVRSTDSTETITKTETASYTVTSYSTVKTVTFKVMVTAENGATKTYTVTVSNRANIPIILDKISIDDKPYQQNREGANKIALRFGAEKEDGYRSRIENQQGGTNGATLTGLDISGKKSGDANWMATAYGRGGWQYNVNGEWVSITQNSADDSTGFVSVPNNDGLEFAVQAQIVYSDGVPYAVITHKIKNTTANKKTGVRFGAYSDTLISSDSKDSTGDNKPFTATGNGAELTQGSYTFEIICNGGMGIDKTDMLWLGEFNLSENPALHVYEDKRSSGSITDSAAAYSWQNVTVPAKGVVTKTIRIALR